MIGRQVLGGDDLHWSDRGRVELRDFVLVVVVSESQAEVAGADVGAIRADQVEAGRLRVQGIGEVLHVAADAHARELRQSSDVLSRHY